MEKYELTVADIENGINRMLTEIYIAAKPSENPSIFYITAGPGAGKTGIELYLKSKLKEQNEKCTIVNSDKIAEFHPQYEDAIEELPEDCYRITRQFVRPATPIIFQELKKHRINILNENTFDKGQSDIDLVKDFKDENYKISINIIATDSFESRLSCFEREASMLEIGLTPRGISKETQERMYNSFIEEIQELETLGFCDELNVFTRGEKINKPNLVYNQGSLKYRNFKEAIIEERKNQRNEILSNPSLYLERIDKVKRTIEEYGVNEVLTKNSFKGLKELQGDFIQELSKIEEHEI